MTNRAFRRTVFRSLLLFALFIPLLSACQSKETLPQPAFPLNEESLSVFLEEQGLDWTIAQTHSPSEDASTFTLLRPESGKAYGDVVLTTGDTPDRGRYLEITHMIFKDDLRWPLEEPYSWEEWKDIFLLSARLYGGFEDAEELYEACTGTSLPLDNLILFKEQLTGGYCQVSVSAPIQDWTPFHDSAHYYHLTLALCGTKDNLTA